MAAKVSILIPVYNISEFLPRCLNSCINQTLKDIEIVCVNDGSKDDSLNILKEYAEKDNRIKIVDKQNGGLPSARNAGLDAATGEYVMFVDGDDWIKDDACECLYSIAKKRDANVVIFGGRIEPLNKTTNWTRTTLNPPKRFFKTLSIHDFLSLPYMFPFLWRNFVKRKHIEKNNFRLDESVSIGEDLAFQFKLLPLTSNVVSIPNVLYYYDCSREGSLTNNEKYTSAQYKFKKHLPLIDSVYSDWEKRGLIDTYGNEFLSWAIDFIYWNFAETNTAEKASLANSLLTFFSKKKLDTFKPRLSQTAKDELRIITKWSKFEHEENKLITVVFNVGLNPDIIHFLAFIDNLQEYRDILNIEVVMNYYQPLEYIKFEKTCFKNQNVQFNLIHDYEEFGSYDRIIANAKTKYVVFTNYDSVIPFKEAKIIDTLKEDYDVVVVGDDFENSPKRLFNTFLGNMIFNVDFCKKNNFSFGEYGMFGGLMFRLKLLTLNANIKFLSNIVLSSFAPITYTVNTPTSFLNSLNAILNLYNLYKETNNEEYLLLATTLTENDEFIRSTQRVAFAWNEKSLPIVRDILEKIIEISNLNLDNHYPINRLLLAFVTESHKHMSALTVFQEKTKKQIKKEAKKVVF